MTDNRKSVEKMGKLIPFRRPGEVDWHQWLSSLRSDDSIERLEALEAPPDVDPSKIVPHLIKALLDDDALVRVSAAEIMGFFPSQETHSALRQMIESDGDALARAYALSSFGLVAQSADDLSYLLDRRERETDSAAKIHLMMGLSYAARRLARKSITPMLAEEDPVTRSLAAQALISLAVDTEDVDRISTAISTQLENEKEDVIRDELEMALTWLDDQFS